MRLLHLLGRHWLSGITDIDERLRRRPAARIADLACDAGWSSIAMAAEYPLVRVDGFDPDEATIAAARRNAFHAGLADRLVFTAASSPDVSCRYDLVTIFAEPSSMTRAAEALGVARRLVRPGGCVIAGDVLAASWTAAGFSDVEVVPSSDDALRLCRLTP